MEKHIYSDVASRLDKALSLVRKAEVASKKSAFIKAISMLHEGRLEITLFSRVPPRKEDTKIILDIYSEKEFAENFPVANYKLNYYLKHGILP